MAALEIEFGTQVRKGPQFECTFEFGTMTSGCTSWDHTAMALCRLRTSQDSRAVGRYPTIPRSLEYRTILYKITTFVLDNL